MDDRHWGIATPKPGSVRASRGLLVSCTADAGATLISGDLSAAIDALAPGAPMLGLLDDKPPGPHALRIARDRALLITEAPLRWEGWQDGYAASAADDLHLRITITGRRAAEIRSMFMSVESGSASCSTLFAGCVALVVSVEDGLCVRITQPKAAAVWAHLNRIL